MDSAARFRIAPSPTGMLHVGTARTALFNWLEARRTGGTFVLRIEDTDQQRNQPEAIEQIQQSLRWLGLDWDEGPNLQSERAAIHMAAAQQLFRAGQVYWCECTAQQVQERAKLRGGPPGYDRYCRDRGLDRASGRILRFRTPLEGQTSFVDLVRGKVTVQNINIGDFSIARHNWAPLFLLANAVDDQHDGITHVVRGEDHLTNTAKYLLLWQALTMVAPPVFAHLPLLVDEKRKKLSKRYHRVALESFRDEGYLPEVMVNYLALLGWGPGTQQQRFSRAELIEQFRLSDVVPSPAYFDLAKLEAFNGETIRSLPIEQFLQRVDPWMAGQVPGFPVPWKPEQYDQNVWECMAPLVQQRITKLSQAPGYVDFLMLASPEVDPDAWSRTMNQDAMALLEVALGVCDDHATEWRGFARDTDTGLSPLAQAFFDEGSSVGLGRSKTQAVLRVAITGRRIGPPLFEAIEVLGRKRTVARLRAALARLKSERA